MFVARSIGFLLLCMICNAVTVSVYITDLPVFSSLAPCAASALSGIVQGLTWSQCPPAITALQSCACSKDQNSAAILTAIESVVTNQCGTTATEDVTSATQVFDVYCGEPTPTTTIHTPAITQYISDISAFSDLAPCAQSVLSNAVLGLTWSICPPEASALASCACIKNQNSLYVSKSINDGVFKGCGTTHGADVASAEAVFAGYCGLNNDSSSFPTPEPLSGSLSYYITDLLQFSSLAPCAQTAVSNQVQGCTWSICPAAAGMLVSCVCAKDQNSQFVTSGVVSNVKGQCGTTDAADISSALAVFDYYCSAGKGLVTPAGITATVTSSGSNGKASSTAKTGGSRFTMLTATSTGIGALGTIASDNGSTSSNPGSSSNTSTSSKSTHTGAIAGGVVGGCTAIVIAGILLWLFRRRRSSERAPDLAGSARQEIISDADRFGKQELSADTATRHKPNSSLGPVTRKAVAPSGLGQSVALRSNDVELSYEAALRAVEAPVDSNHHVASVTTNPAELSEERQPHELSGIAWDNVHELPSQR